MQDTRDIANELKKRLKEAVQGNTAEGLLFSGGLDTSVLAVLNPNMNPAPQRGASPRPSKRGWARVNPAPCFWMPRHLWRGGKRGGVKAITVSLESFGEDVSYAKLIAKHLKLNHYRRTVNVDEAIDAIPDVIKILKSFDPAIPNDLVVYFGLKVAKEMGIEEVMTGDGSDELFAGYNFMQKMNDLEDYIKRISQNMRFSSNCIGDFFGMNIVQPFLEKEFVNFALSINLDLKLKRYGGKSLGKWILRKAFEDILPKEIIWQDKRPLESGSGMTKIREIISSKVCDEEFERVNKSSSIKFINKEHFYYYGIYRSVVGEIPKPNDGEKKCTSCGAGMDPRAFHCKVCGYTSDWRA